MARMDRLSFFSDSLREALHRRMRELIGLALIGIAIALALCSRLGAFRTRA